MDLRISSWALLVCAALAVARTPAAEPGPEGLGWKLGVAAWSFNRFTLLEAIDQTAALGLKRLELFEGQRISTNSDEKLSAALSQTGAELIRQHLTATGVKLTSIYIHSLPTNEIACRQAFELCGRLGLETIISEPPPEALNLIERLCDQTDVRVAIHNHSRGLSRYWDPQEVLRVCEGRSPRLGVCADIGHWQRSRVDPVESVRRLGGRLLALHVKDLNQANTNGHDVVWGTGQGRIAEVLRAVHDLRIKPPLFTVEYEYNWLNNGPEIAQCAKFFARTAAEIEASQPQASNISGSQPGPERLEKQPR
jgi:sugar phosphate isomerase/epimerase